MQSLAAKKLVPELRDYLQQRLPEYMVPTAFVLLETLPLSPNGKIDRRALPAPDQTRPELLEDFVAPRTPIEEVVAQIWAEVFALEQVGVFDNFLELGGHSLLVIQIISRLREIFPVTIPMSSFFGAPTVAELAAQLEAEAAKAQINLAEIARTVIQVSQMSDEEAAAMLKGS